MIRLSRWNLVEYQPQHFARHIALRNCPVNSRFLPPIDPDLLAQELWFKEYLRRDDDQLFAIEGPSKVEGFIGLYDISDSQAEWGRWIVDSDSLAGVPSAFMLLEYAFESLNLDQLVSRTSEKNISVLRFHNSLGSTPSNSGIFLDIRGQRHHLVEHKLNKAQWNEVKPFLSRQIMRLSDML